MPDFLYIHIPFCIRKCVYCDFLSVPYDKTFAQAYIDALCKELELRKDFARTLKAVYIGGGTPSLLSENAFRKLFLCLRNNFHLSADIEISVEANPGTLTESKINALLSLGANRFSVGVQSFDDDELKTLGRVHNSSAALRAVEILKKKGSKNISIDLMYGIPGQTAQSWMATLSTAVGLSPHHISAYELTPEKGTQLWRSLELRTLRMPEEDTAIGMYNQALDHLAACGYGQYEISNFALSGFECVHNLNYWNRGQYIGAGAGAHSFSDGTRSRNTVNIKEYIEGLADGEIPETESIGITAQEAVKELLFLGLRKKEGIDMKVPGIPEAMIIKAVQDLVHDGFIEMSGDRLRLTRKGLMISNTVVVALFEKLGL
jgi:oxygen-independent coproporphyrinogen-3 oxidase